MRFFKHKKGICFRSAIAGLILTSILLAPISETFEEKRTEAFIDYETLNTVWNGFSANSGLISAAANSIAASAQKTLALKEFALDGIAWALINIVIKEMIRSVTMWVASGFKGSPAFLTDFQGFLLDIADKYAGNFIYGTPLGLLCSPFKLNIQFALDLHYNRTRGFQSQCRLSGIVRNMENFVNGNFTQGGWAGWFNLALDPKTNPYQSTMDAEYAMYIGIRNAQGREVKILDFGRGFLTVKQCVDDESGGHCKNVTPGAVVESQLNQTLGLPAGRLNVADEINELVGALLSQLAKEVLGGIGGLLGLSDKSYGAGNYWSRVDAETNNAGYASDAGVTFKDTLDNENKYLSLNRTIVSLVGDAQSYRQRTYPAPSVIDPITGSSTPGAPCTSGDLTPSLKRALDTAQKNIASTTIIILDITTLKTDYEQLQSQSTSSSTLTSLIRKYRGASLPDAKAKLLQAYLQYQSSGKVHSTMDTVNLELQTVRQLRDEVTAFKRDIDTACMTTITTGL